MKQSNYIVFIVLSMMVLMGWQTFVLPRIAPKKPPAKNAAAADAIKNQPLKPGEKKPAADTLVTDKLAAAKSDHSHPATPPGKNDKTVNAKPEAAGAKQGPPKSPAHFERKSVVLGSEDPLTGFFLRAQLTSKGGAVDSVELNDPRYRELKNAKIPLRVVGSDPLVSTLTLGTDVPVIAAALGEKESLADVDWSVVDVGSQKVTVKEAGKERQVDVNTSVTFRYPAPDGQMIVEKRYSLVGVKPEDNSGELRDTDNKGYLLHLDITLRNTGAEKTTATYVLQGPVGLPLENADNTRKFRDIRMGFLTASGTVNAQSKPSATAVSDKEKDKDQEWKTPLKYIGVDVQYFAALLIPCADQLTDQTVARSMPEILDQPRDKQLTDLSVLLESRKIELDPKQSVTHQYDLFAGPKRKALLQPLQAEGILDSTWMAPAIITHAMLALLQFFHSLGLSYGVAIICLTIVVRACMFPVTLRQTMQAQRMKEMQPKLQELKKKHGKDKEKFAMAQMQLMREHKVNPLSGCLPLFLQLPILGGLWTALNSAVDLRRAPFLYFDNLAAPDSLFHLPFAVPITGWTEFNLLPIITVSLFVVQQKMFMPPPTDEQQAMQYKMMNVMSVVMGAMFYRVPAGLCVYLICSSLWGLSERKLLQWWKPSKSASESGSGPSGSDDANGPNDEPPPRAPRPGPTSSDRNVAASIWQRLLNAADDAGTKATSGTKSGSSRRDLPPGKKNGKRSR
jgi:YidC/Oxa1 family membrane protein insertase